MLSILLSTLLIPTVYSNGWTKVEMGKYIDYDLESTPIEIKTTTASNSGESIGVKFFDSQKGQVGSYMVLFNTAKDPSYSIGGCHGDKPFDSFPTVPQGENMIWRFSKIVDDSAPDDITIQIHCNDNKLVDHKLSDTICTQQPNGAWKQTYWSKSVKKISFDTGVGSKSEFYRGYTAPKQCSAGSYDDNGQCKKCPKDTFSAAGDKSCTKCPHGEQSAAGSTSENDCQKYEAPSHGISVKISVLLLSSSLALFFV